MEHLLSETHAVTVSVEALSKVAPFCAHNDIRYYLRGIAVIPLASGGVLAAATNGHAILCARDRDGQADRTVILPISNKRNKAALKAGGKVRMTQSGAIFTQLGKAVHFVLPEGEIKAKFPDITDIFGTPDQYEPGIVGGFNLQYLKLIESAGKYEPVRFWTKVKGWPDGDKLGMFTIGKDVFGGVMPLRDQGEVRPVIADIIPADAFKKPKPAAMKEGD